MKGSTLNFVAKALNIKNLGFVSLTFSGHEESLFKTHLSFKDTCHQFSAPVMSISQPLRHIASLNLHQLEAQLNNQMSPLLGDIFDVEFTDDDPHSDERKVDKPYLHKILTTFVKFSTFI